MEDTEKVSLELNAAEVLVVSESMAAYCEQLAGQEMSIENICKMFILKGVGDQIAALAESVAGQQSALLKALQKEREAKGHE